MSGSVKLRLVTFGEVMIRLAPEDFLRVRQVIPGRLESSALGWPADLVEAHLAGGILEHLDRGKGDPKIVDTELLERWIPASRGHRGRDQKEENHRRHG